MALYSGYDSGNRVVDQGKVITYSTIKTYNRYTVDSLLGSGIDYEFEYTRTCTKSYRYVGMSKTDAETCAAAMIQKYTRSTKVSEWQVHGTTAEFVDVTGGARIMAQVAVVHVAGCMYDVQINVNEVDTRIRESAQVTPSDLFTAENQRDYDEGD